MKYIFFIVSMVTFVYHGFAQGYTTNNIIDSSTYGKWPMIRNEQISDDGNIIAYEIEEGKSKGAVYMIQSVVNDYKRVVKDVLKIQFADNSHSLGVLLRNGELLSIKPNIHEKRIAADVSNLFMYSDNGEMVVYSIKGIVDTLVFLKSGKRRYAIDFKDVMTSPDRKKIFVIRSSVNAKSQLLMIDVQSGKSEEIWNGAEIIYSCVRPRGGGIAISVKEEHYGNYITSLLVYDSIGKKFKKLIDDLDPSLHFGDRIFPSAWQFNQDGTRLLITLTKKVDTISSKSLASDSPIILNQTDAVLEVTRAVERELTFNRSAIFNVLTNKLVYIEDELVSPRPESINGFTEQSSSYLFGSLRPKSKLWFKDSSSYKLVLINLTNGKCDLLCDDVQKTMNRSISPDGQYVVWFDWDSLSYVSYEIATGRRRLLGKEADTQFYDYDAFKNTRRRSCYGLRNQEESVTWIPGSYCFLVYDRFDIWIFDPSGSQLGKNITNFFGRRHGIVFSLLDESVKYNLCNRNQSSNMILVGFNVQTKENGFWKLDEIVQDPKKLVMNNYYYYLPRISEAFKFDVQSTIGFKPIKARTSNCWLVKRMNVSNYPNLYLTRDFVQFKAITQLNPQSKFNWITSELINWEIPGIGSSKGILYKPSNFDSTRKYPLIFNYYVRRTDELGHNFIFPNYTRANLDIPTFVSNGYLVFVPDIDYVSGKNGDRALAYLESAARYLCKNNWVDSTKLGLQGHSFGGYITNYLVTHSNVWAAACEFAGSSNLLSAYNQLNYESGNDRQLFYETFSQGSAFGFGVTPWTNLDLYIKNSPIFYVHRVSTPLLIVHNRMDRSVPFEQGMELFLALRRNEKNVWFIQYNDEDHLLSNDANAMDFTRKLMSFFDYYLRNRERPVWMETNSKSINYRFEDGYQIGSFETR